VKALTKRKEGKGQCFDIFGVNKYEECIFAVV
jgi:hypothetical protein